MVLASLALRQTWRGYSTAVRLGWAVSSNWTRPLTFVIYTILRPISGALILVVMYSVITGGRADTRTYLAFLVIGVAFLGLRHRGSERFRPRHPGRTAAASGC